MVSYAHDRAEMPSMQDTCHVLGRVEGTLVLDCDVDFGSSGAPVFDLSRRGAADHFGGLRPRARSGDQKVSLGTALEAPLAEMQALLAAGDGVFTRPARPR